MDSKSINERIKYELQNKYIKNIENLVDFKVGDIVTIANGEILGKYRVAKVNDDGSFKLKLVVDEGEIV